MPVRPSDEALDELVATTLTRQSLPAALDPTGTIRRPPAPGVTPPAATDTFQLEPGAVLGEGGMGVVRLARQASLGRTVAVKSLKVGASDAENVRLLLRESRVIGRLEHPNIVPVHGLAWDPAQGPQLVMKRIEGEPWRTQLADGGGLARLDHHLGILSTVCQAVHFAHARGVVHRDIKPANVMVGAFGEVYLVDWGVARLVDDPPEEDAGLLGSPAYLAPEMLLGGTADARTDVYLLGATLHFLLTGRPRHRGNDLAEVLKAAARSDPFAFDDGVPTELAALCNRACDPDPARRPADALAFREALLGFQRHRASVSVGRQARALLGTVDDGAGDPLERHRTLSTARFGFEQALREWPENAEARDGREACLRRLLELEFDAGNLRAAQLLAAELPPDPALAARLDALRARVAQQAHLERSLASLRRDLKLEGAGWGRSLVTLVTGTLSGLYFYAGGVLVRTRVPQPTFGQLAAYLLVAFAITTTGLLVFRKQLLDNRIYRRLMTAFALTPLLLVAGAWFGMRTGATFEQLVFGGIYMMTSFALILATVVSPVFWVTLVDALAVSWAATADPSHAVDWAAIGWTAHSFWIAWALRPSDAIEREG